METEYGARLHIKERKLSLTLGEAGNSVASSLSLPLPKPNLEKKVIQADLTLSNTDGAKEDD